MDKSRKRLTIGPLPPSENDVIAMRKAVWAGWIEECQQVQDEWVEARLDELPKEG